MRKRGQGLIEYIVVFAVIVATILIMGYYIRNSLSGKYRDSADTFGGGDVFQP